MTKHLKCLLVLLVVFTALSTPSVQGSQVGHPATPMENALNQLSDQNLEVAQAHYYFVYYWCTGHPKKRYGCYPCPLTAQRVAYALQRAGYYTQIQCDY